MDPELGIDLVSLGMVEEIKLAGHSATVVLRETYLSCIAVPVMRADVRARLAEMDVEADVVTGAPWSADVVSGEGLEKLRELGIAVDSDQPVRCPFCGSAEVVLDSAFGSAPCRASFSCSSCRTPFDLMRSPAVRAARAAELSRR
jgi:ring-1,2-phenylacetyl-CoA epoxidase subunit PaaD